jgi:SAM-dependent methyltransferase
VSDTPIGADGWQRYSIWEHSSEVHRLYEQRCRLQAEEMTTAAQAAELLAPRVASGDTVLDAGCGSGYFYHSLRSRQVPVEYYGIDAAPSLVAIGQRIMPEFGLPADRIQLLRIEDLAGSVDHVVCLSVLANIDNYHRPLERLLQCARKTVIIRESCAPEASYAYVTDRFLDAGVDLKVHVNSYPLDEFTEFIASYGYDVRCIEDRRTRGLPEMIIGYPHHWKFFVAERRARP